ncbi:hypothetical protein ECHOSC_0298 [Ehrlichia chaffeensis str. Osceola]|nr:hypothetical protein ECHOSC_0298 [Ehrlichia chaffeensis str. Osceola]
MHILDKKHMTNKITYLYTYLRRKNITENNISYDILILETSKKLHKLFNKLHYKMQYSWLYITYRLN